MKTFDQYISDNNGQYVEVTGGPLNQCVDNANAYIRDVLGLPIIPFTNAVDFPAKAGTAYDYIKNTPTNVPVKGDIMIWGKPYGPYWKDGVLVYAGHIAIVVNANINNFNSFDQNEPIGSKCHIQFHTYKGVVGWLRKKVVSNPEHDIVVKVMTIGNSSTTDTDKIAQWKQILK